MAGANDRTGVGARRSASPKDEYQTPDELYAPLNRIWRFDFDPAASHANAKTEMYATKDGVYRLCTHGSDYPVHELGREAPRHAADRTPCPGHMLVRGVAADGLTTSWENRYVFCNPPFSDIARWVAKMDAERERAACIIAILPEARDTQWWFEHVRRRAIDIPIRPRTRFIHPPFECEEGCSLPVEPKGAPKGSGPWGKGHVIGQPMASPPGGIAVVEFRPDWLLP